MNNKSYEGANKNLENKIGIEIPHDAQARMDQLIKSIEGDSKYKTYPEHLENKKYGNIKE